MYRSVRFRYKRLEMRGMQQVISIQKRPTEAQQHPHGQAELPVRPVRQVVHPHVVVQDAQAVALGRQAARLRRVRPRAHDALAPQAAQARALRREATRVRRLREEVLREVCARAAVSVSAGVDSAGSNVVLRRYNLAAHSKSHEAGDAAARDAAPRRRLFRCTFCVERFERR